jgi:hypothetical protein
VPLDREAIRSIAARPQVSENREAHAHEHSHEVHLPFLQTVLGGFTVVPLVVGRASADEVAEVLDRLWGGEETLIVVSSDLSHYLAYDEAKATDRETARTILLRRPQINHNQACGATPVNGLLTVALSRDLKPELFDLRNSGDTAGDRSRQLVTHPSASSPRRSVCRSGRRDRGDRRRGAVLIPSRAARSAYLRLIHPVNEGHAFLHEMGASFVTLTRHGRLRGCIGSSYFQRPLLQERQGQRQDRPSTRASSR